MKSTAEVRRALALTGDATAARQALAAPFAELATASGLPTGELAELVLGYLFDHTASALLATTDARAAWFAGPLFVTVGPGNAAFVDDIIAALIAAPILAKGGALAAIAMAHRFAPRADDALALAVAALPRDHQVAALEALFAPVDGVERQVLAIVQCGRVVAWSPHLADTAIGARVISALLELLSPTRPKPLLDEVARALGPIARGPSPLAQRVRDAALAAIDALARPVLTSFAAEVAAIGAKRALPDRDRWLAEPTREAAAAAAYVLGAAAPVDREAFIAYRALVLDRPERDGGLFEPFLAGLISAAHIPAATELATALFAQGGEATAAAFTLAATLPLDALEDVLVGELDSEAADHRALACGAVDLIDGVPIDRALALRLGDPVPDVAAAAAQSLLARGRRDLIADHANRETQAVRTAIAAAALGDLGVPVVGELTRTLLGAFDQAPDGEGPGIWPLLRFTAARLLGSGDGLDTLANLIAGVPESTALFALAIVDEFRPQRDVGILAPPGPRSRLATAVMTLATTDEAGAELGTLALGLLAHVSAGDTTLADVIADALASTEGYAGNLIAALGELGVATPRTGAVLATLLAPTQPLGARILAASVSGRTLPPDHAAWAHVRELLELGTIARAAAWGALRDRARRG